MSDDEKIESGKYIAVSKVERNIKNFLLIIAVLGLIATSVRKFDLTFDNEKQKQDVIKLVEKPIATEREMYQLQELATDPDRHMSFEEKKKLIIVEQTQLKIQENQVKIGQDLQEIKHLLKQKK